MSLERRLEIGPDIASASTLPGWAYADAAIHAAQRERIFRRSWQLLAPLDTVRTPGLACPVTLLDGCLDEPLLLTRDQEDRLHCVSNVCTHRAALVCEHPAQAAALRCRYHGRRFALDGRFLSMPEFEGAAGFPSPADDLAPVPFAACANLIFASLEPAVPFDAVIGPFRERCGFLPLDSAVLDPARARDYLVSANWALYCDNYLEGFHIPFVHQSLASGLDYGAYRTELFPWASVQVAIANRAEDCFDLPAESPDAGSRVAAYYFWLWPNTMLNVYPWGISVNVVKPLGVDRTRVTYLACVWDASRLDRGVSAELDRVEREDEAVVESVQRGVRSRLYDRGRYSPTRETAVHHFHRLFAAALEDG